MNEDRPQPLLSLVVALAASVPIFLEAYQQNLQFRWAVDQVLARAVYRIRLRRWRWRVWDRLSGPQRELWEQKHGPAPEL